MGAPSNLCFQLDLTFFGFDASYRVQLHDTIFNIIWFGEGRWDWDTVYNMPVFLRNFWIKKINEIIDNKKQAIKQQQQQQQKTKS
jgi:hypothetical protein